jgi:hypothetical protein
MKISVIRRFTPCCRPPLTYYANRSVFSVGGIIVANLYNKRTTFRLRFSIFNQYTIYHLYLGCDCSIKLDVFNDHYALERQLAEVGRSVQTLSATAIPPGSLA